MLQTLKEHCSDKKSRHTTKLHTKPPYPDQTLRGAPLAVAAMDGGVSDFPEILKNDLNPFSKTPHNFTNCTFTISRPATERKSSSPTHLHTESKPTNPTFESRTTLPPDAVFSTPPVKPEYDPTIHLLEPVPSTELLTDNYEIDEYDDFFAANIHNIPDQPYFPNNATSSTKVSNNNVNKYSAAASLSKPAESTLQSVASPTVSTAVASLPNRPKKPVKNPYVSTSSSATVPTIRSTVARMPTAAPQSTAAASISTNSNVAGKKSAIPTERSSFRRVKQEDACVWFNNDTVMVRGETYTRKPTPHPEYSGSTYLYAPGFYPGDQRHQKNGHK